MSTLKVNDILEATSGGGKIFPARAWVNLNGTGTVAIRNDGGVSSITDNATGQYTVTLANAFSGANYSISALATWKTGVTASTNTTLDGDSSTKPTSSTYKTHSFVTADDSTYDPEFVLSSAHGDLA